MNPLIQIKSLQAQYDLTLNRYQDLYQTFLQNLQSNEWKVIQGATYLGDGGLAKQQVADVEECQNMCANADTCTGATFNSTTRTCWTRKGDGNVNSTQNRNLYAVLPTVQLHLVRLQRLNQQLLDLNAKIMDLAQRLTPEQIRQQSVQQRELIQTYEQLQREQKKLLSLSDEYDTIVQSNEEQTLVATSQHAWLMVWMVLAVVVLFVTLRSISATDVEGTASGSKGVLVMVAVIGGWYMFKYLL